MSGGSGELGQDGHDWILARPVLLTIIGIRKSMKLNKTLSILSTLSNLLQFSSTTVLSSTYTQQPLKIPDMRID